MRRAVAVVAMAALVALAGAGPSGGDEAGLKAPPFPSNKPKNWVGTPVTWEELQGPVVMLDVWTFGCVNCVRTLPWIKQVSAKYAERGFRVVGIHTPEFEHERGAAAVAKAVKEHGLDYPQYIDNNQQYWAMLKTNAWPTTYLVDRCGRIRMTHVGEVHAEDESGRAMERAIQTLLAEKPCPS